jgi:hypothetical protein
VAVFFFGILGVNEWIVVFISTLLWFLNVVLPVAIGSYFVLKFSPHTSDSELAKQIPEGEINDQN